MITKDKILSRAVDECLKELYSYIQPSITWEQFEKECEEYSKKYIEWKNLKERPNIEEYCGPRPYEFYYLPKEIMKDICDSYVYAYRFDQQQELLDTIEVLKNYCKEPIVDKYIDDWTDETGFHHPGYRSYDHPDNLKKEIQKLIQEYDSSDVSKEISEKCCNKFFEFLDMAGNFFNWNRDLNTFNCSVYLGPSPNSNKEAVIENWKKYRNQDIEIDEEQIKKNYYGEELD